MPWARHRPVAKGLDAALVDNWLERRNDVRALHELIGAGFVVDTIETAARWRDLPAMVDAVLTAVRVVDHTVAVSVHQSHAYSAGACCYFTFGGQPPGDGRGLGRGQ